MAEQMLKLHGLSTLLDSYPCAMIHQNQVLRITAYVMPFFETAMCIYKIIIKLNLDGGKWSLSNCSPFTYDSH